MKKGFTLVEVMMVMVVMAIIATLATGAALKSIKVSKEQRINAMRATLEMALFNYRTNEGRWPLVSGEEVSTNTTVFKGTKNAYVFAPLIASTKKEYLDPSAFLTKVSGFGVISLREALERKISPESCALGYMDPDEGDKFKYYKVSINYNYDMVKVDR